MTLHHRYNVQSVINTIRKPLFLACSAAAASTLPTMTWAEGFALEEVVVTARKREESLQEAAVTVSAFTSEALQRRQITGTDELDMVTPNLQFASNGPLTGNSSASQVFIRGIGQTDATSSVDPGVGLYIDDVYIGSSVGGSMDFRDISNVQVVRGPQGTLFGRNTIGGAVLLTTTAPGDELGGSVKVGVGEDSLVEYSAAVDIPLSDSVKTRFTYGARQRDGYVFRPDGTDLGDEDTFTVTGKLLWETEDFSLLFKADYTEEDENGVPYVFAGMSQTAAFPAALSVAAGCPGATFPPPFVPNIADSRCANTATWQRDEFSNEGTVAPESTLENSGVGMIAKWHLNDQLSAKSVTSFRTTEWSGVRDADNTPFVILHTDMVSDGDQFSQEFQFNYTAENMTSVLGLFYFESSYDEVLTVDITPPFAPVIPVNNGAELDSDNWAVFGEMTYDVTDQLAVTFGARYTEETKDAIIDAFGGPPVAPPGTSGLTEVIPPAAVATRYVNQEKHSLDFSDTSIHFNVSYQWADNFMTYLNYSEAFKSGGWNPLYNAIQPDKDLEVGDIQNGPGDPTNFDPEEAETWEIGFKSDITDNLRVNGAIFTTDYTDLQFTYRVGIVPLLFNAGEASIDGAELEFTYTPSSSFILEGSLGVLDGTIDSAIPITTRAVNGTTGVVEQVPATATVEEGDSLPYTPDLSANIGASYIFDLDSGWSVTPRLDVNYVDSQYFDAGNTDEIAQVDSQVTARFALTIEDSSGNLRIVTGVDNLTDELYPVAGNSSLTTSSGYAEIVYNRGRTWYANLEYNF